MTKKLKYLEQKIRYLNFLNDLGKSLSSTLDPHRVVDIIASELTAIVKYDIFSLLFFSLVKDSSQPDYDNDVILKIKSDFDIKGELFDSLKYNMLRNYKNMTGEHISIRAIDAKHNVNRLCCKTNIKTLSRASHIKTYISIPLCDTENKKLGVINLASFDKQKLPEHAVEVLFDAAYRTTLALKNAVQHEKLTKLARMDGLTNVYNRIAFEDMFQNEYNRALRYKKPISLVMIDVDNLKTINDREGHQAGDAVLKDISKIMLSSIRKTDMLARYGGDEFVIILPDTDIKKTDRLTKRIHENIRRKCIRPGGDIRPTVSIGVANLQKHKKADCKKLIKLADDALYTAKRQGRDRSVNRV